MPRFDGDTFDHARDHARLTSQLERVKKLMADGQYRTLHSIVMSCGGTEASASARLRDLRKNKFGAFVVRRRRIVGGLYEYQLVVPRLDEVKPPEPVVTARKLADDLFPINREPPS